MKKFIPFYYFLFFTIFINAQNLKSPHNNFDLIFTIDENGRPTYSLNFQEEPVILNSGLGFTLKDNVEWMKTDTLDMISDFKVVNVSFDNVDETWNPVWGEENEIRNNYNEMFVELEQKESQRKVNIRFRLFDDSLGFRYEFPLQENLGSFIIIDEKTEFAMTGDHKAIWIPGDYDTQEYNYTTSKLTEIKQKRIEEETKRDPASDKKKLEEKTSKINLVLDQSLPYSVIQMVMHTAAEAGFTQYKFIVQGKYQ